MTPTNLGGVFLLNKYFRIIISIFLVLSIVFSSFTSLLVYATDSDNPDDIYDSDKWNSYDNSDITNVIVDQLMNRGIHKGDADFYENFIRYASEYIAYGLGQIGAIIGGDLYDLDDNKERLYEDLKNITDNGKITIDKTSRKIIVNKNFTNTALNFLKAKTKEPDNGGYELVKTVPASKISSLYFPSPARYTTFKNLLKDNGGIIGLQIYGGYKMCFYKVRSDVFWVGQADWNFNDSGGNHKFYKACGYENTVSSVQNYWCYDLPGAEPAKSWDDTDNLAMNTNDIWSTTHFGFYDAFSYLAELKSESNPLIRRTFLVTASGAPVPVFNTVSDAVAYSVANNLYYTSSDYTGEGKEIVIPFDEIDKILNGYYNGMYDLLQQLIEQNGGNALTPEQLQKLVDEVKASFGMIQDSINDGFEQQDILIQKNSEIMQNIADALNAFFSQTKDVRNAFMKSFNNYAASQKERDEMLYKLLQDYMAEKEKPPESSETEPSEQETEFLDTVKETNGILQDIYAGLGEFKKSVDDAFSDILNALKNIKISPSKPVINDGNGGIWDFLNFATNLAEKLLDGSDEVFDDFMGGITEVGSGLADLFRTRFPFSIPWDIAAFVAALSAPPETPYYEIPITLERYGIDERIVIDLGDFEIISKISRTFLTVIWSMYLMNLTLKFTDVKNKS